MNTLAPSAEPVDPVPYVGPLQKRLEGIGASPGLPKAMQEVIKRRLRRRLMENPYLLAIVEGKESFTGTPWDSVAIGSMFTLKSQPQGSDFVFQKTSPLQCLRLCRYDRLPEYQSEGLPPMGEPFSFSDLRSPLDKVGVFPALDASQQRVASVTEAVETVEEKQFVRVPLNEVPNSAFFIFEEQPRSVSALYLRDSSGILRVGSYADFQRSFQDIRPPVLSQIPIDGTMVTLMPKD